MVVENLRWVWWQSSRSCGPPGQLELSAVLLLSRWSGPVGSIKVPPQSPSQWRALDTEHSAPRNWPGAVGGFSGSWQTSWDRSCSLQIESNEESTRPRKRSHQGGSYAREWVAAEISSISRVLVAFSQRRQTQARETGRQG
ncbi:hypothetical protein K456DRAFT_1669937 [Colletotrichum gloeosporioides 23]|nr:hypothetical protein K456DRAFT_1669937 [Colletotrichum gloeosporioides 23]